MKYLMFKKSIPSDTVHTAVWHCALVLLEYGSSHCLKLAAKACQGPYCAADCDPNETCL